MRTESILIVDKKVHCEIPAAAADINLDELPSSWHIKTTMIKNTTSRRIRSFKQNAITAK